MTAGIPRPYKEASHFISTFSDALQLCLLILSRRHPCVRWHLRWKAVRLGADKKELRTWLRNWFNDLGLDLWCCGPDVAHNEWAARTVLYCSRLLNGGSRIRESKYVHNLWNKPKVTKTSPTLIRSCHALKTGSQEPSQSSKIRSFFFYSLLDATAFAGQKELSPNIRVC